MFVVYLCVTPMGKATFWFSYEGLDGDMIAAKLPER